MGIQNAQDADCSGNHCVRIHTVGSNKSVSDSHTVIATENGIFCRGRNSHGQCGVEDKKDLKEFQLTSKMSFVKVELGREFSLGLTNDGKLYGWGRKVKITSHLSKLFVDFSIFLVSAKKEISLNLE